MFTFHTDINRIRNACIVAQQHGSIDSDAVDVIMSVLVSISHPISTPSRAKPKIPTAWGAQPGEKSQGKGWGTKSKIAQQSLGSYNKQSIKPALKGNARNSEYMKTPSGLNCIPRKKEESREMCTIDMDDPFIGESRNIRYEGPPKDVDDLIRPRWQRKGPQ